LTLTKKQTKHRELNRRMGVAPSRETIRRGFFNVNQVNSSSGGGNNKRQDIVLIPLTKEYFPSPDCPLFVQFHKARCDAAVNYYFRRPGNPGDLSCIPNYESSYRLPGEETRAQRRRRRRLAREARASAAPGAAPRHQKDELGGTSAGDNGGRGLSSEEDDSVDGEESDSDVDDSFPSREALYRGVIEHVEEALFDTDAEMRQAYQWALAHPHTTMGPDGKKQRKVLPVLCAVAFRSDISKVHSLHNAVAASGTATGGAAAAGTRPSPNMPNAGATPSTSSSHMSSSSIAMNNMQAALENGVYMFGSIINIVGCFGFVSMQEDVDDAQRISQQAGSPSAMSPPLLTPGGSMPSPSAFGGGGGTYHHDPYSFTSSQASSGSTVGGVNNTAMTTASGGTLLSTRGAGKKGSRRLAQIGAATDLITLPPPVAAPLAAMVFLTKSAGEQNLGRVTHIAASTYYYQMIQAGLIERQAGVRMEGPNVYPSPSSATVPPPPPYGVPTNLPSATAAVGGGKNAGSAPPAPPPVYSASSSALPPTAGSVLPPPPLTQGPPRPFLPPMETFSFSSLLTNIPVLSFLYEMKWRWGYLGVLKAGTPTAGTSRNSSFNGSMSGHPVNNATARGPGSMMGNHSTGGLAAVDRSVGQGVTDELEMWITVDQMIHGRVSKDLAQRLCWSLAERPEVMQERVSQLPSEESGYWRYRGLVDKTRLPPIPEPGRVVTIHPKDVYVMGSDVLPGFNEGDILRFDPERLVWFADHSIPLEGLVLAAMRPYCKQAREADPEDPSWVTKVCDREEVETFYAGETDAFYAPPAPTAEETTLLASDPNLVHIHEHVGNFYVYRFVRDGTTYYHGTVPNFANPNKKKQLLNVAPTPGASANVSPQGIQSNVAVVSNPANNNGSGSGGADSGNHNAGDSTSNPSANPAFKPSSGANTTSNSKSAVPVPKTIASALFSLLPASRARADGAGGSAAAAANTSENGGGGSANNNYSGRNGTTASAGDATTAAAAPSTTTTTAYLATPVTSNAMNTARRWVQALYSYAYGAPNTAAGARRGPTAASLAASVGGPSVGSTLPGASVVAGPPSSRAGAAVPPLRTVASDGRINANGSYPSTPVQAPHLSAKTPTSGVGAGAFPKTATVATYDVAVWPTPKLNGPINLESSAHMSTGSFTDGVSPAAPPLAMQHSRSSSHSLMGQASGQLGEEAATMAPVATSKPIKRYVEGGSYEWDWRKQ
jgi:hypothetical protein